jgi:hypothetical protein
MLVGFALPAAPPFDDRSAQAALHGRRRAPPRRAPIAARRGGRHRSLSNGVRMGWIVTSWRSDALAAAEREARRVSRGAAREVADARAYLDALERFGADTRAEVRRQRVALRTDGAGAATPVASRRKTARASLRESPLTELFRATAEQ